MKERILFYPAREKVLLELIQPEKKLLVILDASVEPITKGKIVAKGFEADYYNLGDIVTFNPNAGVTVYIDEVEYKMVHQAEIYGSHPLELNISIKRR